MPHVCAINRCQSRNFNGSQFNCGRSVTLSIHGLASAEWSHSGPGPGLVGQPQTSSYPGNIIFTHRKCIFYILQLIIYSSAGRAFSGLLFGWDQYFSSHAPSTRSYHSYSQLGSWAYWGHWILNGGTIFFYAALNCTSCYTIKHCPTLIVLSIETSH